MNKQLNTPVLFLIYRRPDTTKRVFEQIRKAQPKQLFIAADGPKQGEEEKCKQARAAVMDNIDWSCEVKTLFRDKNLGCKYAVSGAIDWFFQNVEEGIILEDDTLPNQSFFRFCEELLERYRDDMRIGSITGSHPFRDKKSIDDSYFFSNFTRIWGWATWRRVWEEYDVEISFWPKVKSDLYHENIFCDKKLTKHYKLIWNECYKNCIDTWDYQWFLCCLLQSFYTIVASKNLVSNIGFGREGAHTRNNNCLANFRIGTIEFPLKHPKFIICDYAKDKYTFKYRMNSTILSRFKKYIKRFLRIYS